MTPEKLLEELDGTVKVPGLTNIWVPPIRNRIEMLATGIKSPIGARPSGWVYIDARGTDLAATVAALQKAGDRGASR